MLHDKYLHMYSDQFLQCYVICYHRYFVRIKHYCLHSLNKPVYNDQLFKIGDRTTHRSVCICSSHSEIFGWTIWEL